MKKMEVSKIILCVSWAATIILSGIAVIGTFSNIDVTNLVTLAGIAWGELTAAHGFYYWKAKNENRTKVPIKVIESLPAEVRDQMDLTQVITSIIQSQ